MKSLILIVLAICASVPLSHAASFNCDKAITVTEQAICENRSLNDKDVKMTTTYNIVRKLVPMGTRAQIQDQQVKWLQLRNQCQEYVSCLSDVYNMRQQKLDIYLNQIYQQGPF